MKKVDSDLNISIRSLSKTPKGNTKHESILDNKKRTVTPNNKTTNLKSPTSVTSISSKIVNNYDLPLHTYASPNQLNPIYEHLHNLCPAT